MNIDVQRIDNSSYRVKFNNIKHKTLIIEIDNKNVNETENNKNHEFFFNLATLIAKNILHTKTNNAPFENVITIGNKEWIVNIK